MHDNNDPSVTQGELGGNLPSIKQLLDLVGDIYDTSLHTELWPCILARIAALYGTDKGSLFSLEPSQPQSAVLYVAGEQVVSLENLRKRDSTRNFWWERSKNLPGGETFIGSELVGVEEVAAAPAVRQFGITGETVFLVGGMVENTPRHLAIITFVRVGRDFEPRDKRLLSLLLPHLRIALFVNRRIGETDQGQRAALDALDSLHHGVVILSNAGEVLFANEKAQDIARRDEGVALKDGRLQFRSASTQGEFEQLVRSAVQTARLRGLQGGGFFLIVRRSGLPLEFVVSPLTRRAKRPGLPAAAACLVFINDPAGHRRISAAWLSKVHGLTPAEVRLCETMFRTDSLAAAARELRITRNTARTQLKSVFVKVGVSSQSQLLRRLAISLPVPAPSDSVRKSKSMRQRKPSLQSA